MLIKEQENTKANQENEVLRTRYGPIIDAEEHVERIIKVAKDDAESLRVEARTALADAKYEANQLEIESKDTFKKLTAEALQKTEKTILDANNEADALKSDAKEINRFANEKLKTTKEKIVVLEEESHSESARIIELAELEARRIAGDAYEAKEKADSYEAAIKAMKNTIAGYKDDYIIPNHSVLDDLAEEYSFKDAGEQLKKSRKRVKEMVKKDNAGDCDYVELHRKTYAIHFAVDAFNGKVDSALSKVKHDNFGKIKQEIIDAFALVNHNGEPFRNARILQVYLDSRLEELKWAVATHELRQIEIQEQKEIKQQIREEERARKEMEKAIKEAEKEERLLQQALEKARAELANANEEQRQEYESQLAELETKLLETEERGKRALSMAQQTRRGHVYVISNIGSFGENVYKIGMTRRLEPMDRVKELGDASVPFSFDVHAMVYCDDAPALEKELHKRFDRDSVNKVNPRKEFFKTTLAEIKQMIESKGLAEIHWTMKAQAIEYRESLAIEMAQKEENVA